MRPDTPAPSSRTVEEGPRIELAKSGFEDEDIHEANKGATFHTTAPVVPVFREEVNKAGDWVMLISRSPSMIGTVCAFESTKPRFEEGMGCVKREKDSVNMEYQRECVGSTSGGFVTFIRVGDLIAKEKQELGKSHAGMSVRSERISRSFGVFSVPVLVGSSGRVAILIVACRGSCRASRVS